MSLDSNNTYHTREVLQKYFGYSDFHPLQEEIIKDVLDHNDVLVLIPTGGGKSLCYQLPAVMNDGITVVISPLIALMKDQVDDLSERGISAVSINSALTYSEISEIKSRLLKKQIKLLYVAPERIVIPDFLDFLRQLNISLFAIDEAHCISEWGHEFRPEYRKLNLLKKNFPAVPLIALTSTAVPQVQTDIVNQLNMVNPKIYRGSLNRKNLFYQIRPKKKEMFQHLLGYIKNHHNDSGIIYRQSRKSVDELSRKLQNKGIRALPYHAGLSSETRSENQEKFIKDDVEIIVATIAFGMGIDKPNIRYVIHCDMPKSIEGYYQETGRAGRDGLKSDCILFFSYSDKIKHEYFIRKIEDEQNRRIAYSKLYRMIDFCTWSKCRRITLLNYFGEKYDAHNCNMCDACAPSEKAEVISYTEPEAVIPKAKKTTDFVFRECDQKLFEILRALRKQIADKQHMPPYIVFSDVSLKDMSTRYPQTMDAFREINGVGDVKLKKYGHLFTGKIVDYCKANKSKAYSVPGIRRECSSAYEKWTEAQEQKLISEYKSGKTISELANLLGRQTGGIRSRLKKLAIQGTAYRTVK
ncbi:MAG: RecQ family ATP-dependent DNA helicase [Planctomycetota bacterium]